MAFLPRCCSRSTRPSRGLCGRWPAWSRCSARSGSVGGTRTAGLQRSSRTGPAGRSAEDAIRIRELQETVDELNRLRAAALEAAQRRDEFLTTISHELRSPLNAILGWTQVLEPRRDLPSDVRDALHVIRRNALRQRQLLDDLVDMSRVVSGALRIEPRRCASRRRSTRRARRCARKWSARASTSTARSNAPPSSAVTRDASSRCSATCSRTRSASPRPAAPSGPGDARPRRGVAHRQRAGAGNRIRIPAPRVRAFPAAAGRDAARSDDVRAGVGAVEDHHRRTRRPRDRVQRRAGARLGVHGDPADARHGVPRGLERARRCAGDCGRGAARGPAGACGRRRARLARAARPHPRRRRRGRADRRVGRGSHPDSRGGGRTWSSPTSPCRSPTATVCCRRSAGAAAPGAPFRHRDDRPRRHAGADRSARPGSRSIWPSRFRRTSSSTLCAASPTRPARQGAVLADRVGQWDLGMSDICRGLAWERRWH